MSRAAKTEVITDEEKAALMQEMQESMFNTESLNPVLDSLYADMGITDGAQTTIHVSMVDHDGKGNDANVWKGDPESYDLESIARRFGSGAYRVMVYVKTPTGQKVRKVNKVISWLLSAEDEAKRKAVTTGAAIAPAAPQTDIAALIREMTTGFENTILKVISETRQPAADPMKSLEGLKSLAEIIAPRNTAPVVDSFAQTMKGVEMFMAISNKMKPEPSVINDDGEISMPAMFMAAIKAFKDMNNPTAATAVPAATVAQPAALPPPTDQPQISEEDKEMGLLLSLQLKQANKAAARGADAEQYAETIYPIIPDDILQMMATQPSWFDDLMKLEPSITPHRAWYLKVAAQIKLFMIDEGLLTAEVSDVKTGDSPTDKPAENGADNAGTGSSS